MADPLDPALQDIQITRGITHDPFVVTFLDENGDQIDLTGWGVRAQARSNSGALPVLDLGPVILPTGTLIGYPGEVDGPGRVKYADFTYQQTLSMQVSNLSWDMILITPDNRRLGTMLAGKCNVGNVITLF